MRRRGLRWSLAILGLLLVLGGSAFFLGKNSLLRALAERRIHRQTGLPARLGQLEWGVRAGSVRLKDLRLSNPPGFGGAPLLDVPELYFTIDPSQLARRKLRFTTLRLHVRELNLIRSPTGQWNLAALVQPAQAPAPATAPKAQPARFAFAGVAQFYLTVDRITYTDLRHPAHSRAIQAGLRDEHGAHLATAAELETWTKAVMLRVLVHDLLLHPPKAKITSLELLLELLK